MMGLRRVYRREASGTLHRPVRASCYHPESNLECQAVRRAVHRQSTFGCHGVYVSWFLAVYLNRVNSKRGLVWAGS